MRDPFTDPFCEAEDLGLALPDSDHAVSVCLPRWEHVIGYEEGDPAVLETFECGYPRFVAHPFVTELFLAAQEEFSKKQESALVFPSLAAAWRCADYVKQRTGTSCRLESYGWENLTVVLLDESAYETGWKCWQHGGEIVSSRLAESALSDAPLDPAVIDAGETARNTIRERIASFHDGVEPGDVFLFSSGMAAIFAIHRILSARTSGLPSIQVEFPYLDSFKVLDEFGGGVVDFSNTESGGVAEVTQWIADGGQAAGLYTEIPSNPLLRTADLSGLAPLLRKHDIPLIVDDTVATCVNVDGFLYADAVTSSLTKAFSGAGDVAAGSVVLNPTSPFYDLLLEALPSEESASPLFARDAIVLEVNSRHFQERIEATNENALALVDWLSARPEVKFLWHPTLSCRTHFDSVRRDAGGYGALFSMELHGGEGAAARFYDHLRLSKGPGLGTNFSLVCPYTLLAHFQEMEWAEARGAVKNLLRIWVGLEETSDLLDIFQDAFQKRDAESASIT